MTDLTWEDASVEASLANLYQRRKTNVETAWMRVFPWLIATAA